MSEFDIENNIRVATPDDYQEIFRIACLLHSENGQFSFNERKVKNIIWNAVNRNGGMCAVIGPVDNIKAMLLLTIEEVYYSDEFEIVERWNYVRPDCRKSNYAKQMVAYAKQVCAQTGLVVSIGIISDIKLEAKRRLYERTLKLGGYWFTIRPEARPA